MKDKKTPLSVEAQKLINDLVANASQVHSDYPIKAMHARKRTDELITKLSDHVASLEQRSLAIPETEAEKIAIEHEARSL